MQEIEKFNDRIEDEKREMYAEIVKHNLFGYIKVKKIEAAYHDYTGMLVPMVFNVDKDFFEQLRVEDKAEQQLEIEPEQHTVMVGTYEPEIEVRGQEQKEQMKEMLGRMRGADKESVKERIKNLLKR